MKEEYEKTGNVPQKTQKPTLVLNYVGHELKTNLHLEEGKLVCFGEEYEKIWKISKFMIEFDYSEQS